MQQVAEKLQFRLTDIAGRLMYWRSVSFLSADVVVGNGENTGVRFCFFLGTKHFGLCFAFFKLVFVCVRLVQS